MARKSNKRGQKVSSLALSKLLGRDRGSFPKWVDEEGMPFETRPDENGAGEWQFYTAEVIDWLIEREMKKVVDAVAPSDGDEDTSKMSKAQAERSKAVWSAAKERVAALMAALNYQKELGRVVDKEMVGAVFNEKLIRVKTRFMDLGPRVGSDFEDDQYTKTKVVNSIDEHVSEILGELSFSEKEI
jgi:hypothetical protein